MNGKLKAAIVAAIMFYIISNPVVYRIVDNILGGVLGRVAVGGCPTTWGLVLHSVVFGAATYYGVGL